MRSLVLADDVERQSDIDSANREIVIVVALQQYFYAAFERRARLFNRAHAISNGAEAKISHAEPVRAGSAGIYIDCQFKTSRRFFPSLQRPKGLPLKLHCLTFCALVISNRRNCLSHGREPKRLAW